MLKDELRRLALAFFMANLVFTAAVPALSQTASWTTSGTRALPSRPNVAVPNTSNETWNDYDPPLLYPRTAKLPMQYIQMTDGVKLAAFVTLPADANGNPIAGRFPTILVISDYNVALGASLGAIGVFVGAADPYMVQHGYATVSVDGRGTGNSTGVWDAWGHAAQSDYPAIVNWVTQQSWTDGKIGLRGTSDLGIQALFAAGTGHPAIKAVFAAVPMADGYRDTVFTGGQGNILFLSLWLSLSTALSALDPALLSDPITAAPLVLSHLQNALLTFQVPVFVGTVLGDPTFVNDGEFWRVRSPIEYAAKIAAPTIIIGAVHDIFQRGEPLLYEQLKNRVTTKLIVLPGTHLDAAMPGNLNSLGVPPFNHIELQWFDHYLKGLNNGADQLPAVTQYFIGLGKLATTPDWPSPAATSQRYYFQSNKTLSLNTPSLLGVPRSLFQTPLDGLCSISTAQWSLGILGLLPLPCFADNSATEAFNLVYQTAPLSADMTINGPIQADVWTSTSGIAGVVSVRVDDVDPSGRATPITNGLMNMKHRAVDANRSRTLNGVSVQPWHPFTLAAELPVYPGVPMKIPVEVFATSAVIKAGNRLRVAIGPSNLPQGIGTGLDLILQTAPGLMTVYSDALHPSSIVLPLVPATSFNPLAPLTLTSPQ